MTAAADAVVTAVLHEGNVGSGGHSAVSGPGAARSEVVLIDLRAKLLLLIR